MSHFCIISPDASPAAVMGSFAGLKLQGCLLTGSPGLCLAASRGPLEISRGQLTRAPLLLSIRCLVAQGEDRMLWLTSAQILRRLALLDLHSCLSIKMVQRAVPALEAPDEIVGLSEVARWRIDLRLNLLHPCSTSFSPETVSHTLASAWSEASLTFWKSQSASWNDPKARWQRGTNDTYEETLNMCPSSQLTP